MSDDAREEKTGIFHLIAMFFERVLESKTSANLLILVLLILAALPISGIGIAVTRAAAPAHTLEQQ